MLTEFRETIIWKFWGIFFFYESEKQFADTQKKFSEFDTNLKRSVALEAVNVPAQANLSLNLFCDN